jgi:hypothetical protein
MNILNNGLVSMRGLGVPIVKGPLGTGLRFVRNLLMARMFLMV